MQKVVLKSVFKSVKQDKLVLISLTGCHFIELQYSDLDFNTLLLRSKTFYLTIKRSSFVPQNLALTFRTDGHLKHYVRWYVEFSQML